MGTKMKGIYKGFKYISQIFVVKEREMEIGYPTDVKHIAHIGWDSQSANGPSWMNNFKTSSDFSAMSVSNKREPRDSNQVAVSTWSPHDFEQAMGRQATPEMFKGSQLTELPKAPKKHKRKKAKSPSSSSGSSRATKPKSTYNATVIEVETTPNLQGVIS